MYALVNVLFKFQLGRVKKNGKIGKRPYTYSNNEDLMKAFSRLSYLQRTIIRPAQINDDGSFEVIKAEYV